MALAAIWWHHDGSPTLKTYQNYRFNVSTTHSHHQKVNPILSLAANICLQIFTLFLVCLQVFPYYLFHFSKKLCSTFLYASSEMYGQNIITLTLWNISSNNLSTYDPFLPVRIAPKLGIYAYENRWLWRLSGGTMTAVGP